MLTRIIHDFCYGASVTFNSLLIFLIATKTPSYLRSYSLVLLYLAIIQLTTAVSSIFVFKKVLSTSSFYIDGVEGVCRHWSSPSLCLFFDAIQMAGTSQHAVMIAFCSCYQYFVIAYSRSEPKKRHVLLALICAHLPTLLIYTNFGLSQLLEGTEMEQAINDSYPKYIHRLHREEGMLLVLPQNWSTLLASLWIQSLIVPVCIIVFVCSLRINCILASFDHMSAHSKERHAEILRGLVIQAVLPALYAITVVVYRMTRAKTESDNQLRHLTPMMASILTALSPILNIYFTLPYREAVQRLIATGNRAPHSVNNSENPIVAKDRASLVIKSEEQDGTILT